MIKRRRYRPPCTYSGILRALYPPDPARDLSNLLPSPRYLTAHPHLWILGPPALPRPLRAPPSPPPFLHKKPACAPSHIGSVASPSERRFSLYVRGVRPPGELLLLPSALFITPYFVFQPCMATSIAPMNVLQRLACSLV